MHPTETRDNHQHPIIICLSFPEMRAWYNIYLQRYIVVLVNTEVGGRQDQLLQVAFAFEKSEKKMNENKF